MSVSEVNVAKKGLRSDSVGLLSSVIIAVSSTAPAYSMAASLGLVVAVAGIHTPMVLVLSFLPMLFIAFAFRELNKVDPDCGITFAWATRAFGPTTGWMGGWGIIAADLIVMSSLSQIAGRYFFLLFGLNSLANSTGWITIAGVSFIALLTWVCYRGIEISVRVQQALLFIELASLVAFAITAVTKVLTHHAMRGSAAVNWHWISPWSGSSSGLSNSFLLAVFIYWGWDCALSVNEETKDRNRTPGRAAVIATVMLVVIFALVSISALCFAGPKFLAANSSDVLSAMAQAVFGSTFGHILVLCVLTSTAASTQTTIIPTSRAVLSMAVYRALPARFARTSERFQTPSVATVAMGFMSAVVFVAMTLISTNVLADSASATGLLIAFYYALTGYSCAWYFRHDLKSQRNLWLRGILPLLGALALTLAFALSIHSYLPAASSYSSLWGMGGVFVIGAGSLLLGLVLVAVARRNEKDFFLGGIETTKR